jgi:S1-C subfamily serine protease
VVIEREDKRYDAFLVATDTKLHLAFIQIEGLGDRALVPIDLEQAASPQVGDPVVAVARLDAGYDYTPYFRRARVGGALEKPRKAWVLDSAAAASGMPVFTPEGAVVGVVSDVESGVADEDEGGGGGMMGMIRRMAQGSGINLGVPFVLPARTVRASAQQAAEKAVTLLAERAAKKAEAEKKPGEGEEKKPDPPKKGDDY